MFDYCSTAADDVRSLSREIGFTILAHREGVFLVGLFLFVIMRGNIDGRTAPLKGSSL